MPEVTVLMPVHNGARHLRAAIDSVLAQTFADFEFLVVNDGSTDDSKVIVDSYRDARIRLLDQPRNLGLSAALNRGLEEARSDLIARQDADDVSHPSRLARQVEFLRNRPAVAILGTQGRVINDAGEFVGVVDRCQDEGSIRWYHVWDNPFIHTSVIFRRQMLLESGGQFESAFDPFSQDYAMWSRVLMRHPAANLPDRLIHYRISNASITGGLNMPETARADERRPAFVPILREIVGRNLRTTFGPDAVSDRDVALASGFVLGLDPGAVEPFLVLFFGLLARYRSRPSAVSAGLRRTVARQIDTVAYRLHQPRRRTVLKIYAQAVTDDPGTLRYLPWPRAAALALFGPGGRGAVKRSALFRRVFAPHL